MKGAKKVILHREQDAADMLLYQNLRRPSKQRLQDVGMASVVRG